MELLLIIKFKRIVLYKLNIRYNIYKFVIVYLFILLYLLLKFSLININVAMISIYFMTLILKLSLKSFCYKICHDETGINLFQGYPTN